MKDLKQNSRRAFLKQTGQLLVGFNLLPFVSCSPATGEQSTGGFSQPGGKDDVDSWIRIGGDGRVTVLTGKMELGQGIKTALQQIAAEELDVSMQQVDIIIADTGKTQDERYTAGSNSIEGSGKIIREAAAEARRMLMELAGNELGVSAADLEVEDGVVKAINSSTGQPLTYGELVQGKRLEGRITGKASTKNPDHFKLVGTAYPRQDILDMVTGKPVFVQDMRLPGMLHARIMRPPSYGARLKSFPKEEVERLPGVVKVVRDGDFLAVIAEDEFQAIKALQHLQQESSWEQERLEPSKAEIFDQMFSKRENGNSVENSLPSDWEGRGELLEVKYSRPYHMHGSMGPSCAIAQMDGDNLMVWSHTQGPYPLRRTLADLLGMEEERIRVKGVPGAGCYGHNGADDVAADAVLLANAHPGPPIRVQWMRMDEHTWEPYGSAMAYEMRGRVDDAGKISAWQTRLWSDSHSSRPGGKAGHFIAARTLENPRRFEPGGFSAGSYRNAVPLYGFPRQIIQQDFEGPLRTSALRSLGAYGNIFALESFMDELAHKAGKDPVAFRLEHLDDTRAKAVIREAAEKSGWNNGGGNTGLGIAFAQYKNSAAYFAVVAHVEADVANQTFAVRKLTGAIDAGQVINVDGLKNQTEGGMIQAASWTLYEEVDYDGQGILSTSWATYPIMRIDQSPEIEVHVIDRPHEKALGAGEAAQGPVSAAIANAIFAATGSRLRDLPLKAEKVDWERND